MELSELQGKIVKVNVPVKGQLFSMDLKICRVKARSILFIEVIKSERKNIFRKVSIKMLDFFDEFSVTFKNGASFEKWESGWDLIGTATSRYSKPYFNNHSKGWSSNAPQYRSTTNNSVSGFPMV
jgi:hypothetical protein